MVDVSEKRAGARMARAAGTIRMSRAAFDAVRQNQVAKGDVLGVARVAGIQAAKRTAELVPLCHQVPLSNVDVTFAADDELPGYRVEATARTVAGTGVEMEALTAVAVALLTLYDMAKALDKAMTIGEIMLLEKLGGKSGRWTRA